MSDSELSDVPDTPKLTDAALANGLRDATRTAFKAGVEYTINTIRAAAESQLELNEGFYTSNDDWKSRSKITIKDELEKLERLGSLSPETTRAPVKRKSIKPNLKTSKRSRALSETVPCKRQREESTPLSESESLSSPPSEFKSESNKDPPRKTKSKAAATRNGKVTAQPNPEHQTGKKKSKQPVVESDEDEDESKSDVEVQKPIDDESDSELSVVLDEEPPKKRRPTNDKPDTKQKGSKTTKAAKANTSDDPNQEEIKKLQSWLVKCGIRKVWGVELKPYETSKSKIQHLREMLTEAGMTGRYSEARANEIKERREMLEDLAAVQEGAERWGTGGDLDADEEDRPKRRLVRGSKAFDFLSSDGEETD